MPVRVGEIGSGRGCLLVHHGACYGISTLALLGREKLQWLSAFLAALQTPGDPGSGPRSSRTFTEME